MYVMAVKSREESLEEARHALRELERKLEELHATLAETKSEDELASLEDVAAQFNISADALRAFAETAGELLAGEALSEADARRAAMVAAARVAWERELGPLLSGAQVRELLGGVSRQRVDELARGRRLISLRERSGRRRYPLFQFEDGQPLEPIVTAFWIVADGAASDWTAASWCVRTDPALGDRSPLEWVRAGKDPERVLQIARQDAARLTR
jgi:hypothetical protein